MGASNGRGAGTCTGNGKKGGSPRGARRGVCGWFNAAELVRHSPEENEELLRGKECAGGKRRKAPAKGE